MKRPVREIMYFQIREIRDTKGKKDVYKNHSSLKKIGTPFLWFRFLKRLYFLLRNFI